MICVYKIQNIKNDKFYIGSTIDFDKRINVHFYKLKRNIHHSIIFQRAYNKYGREVFKASVLEECNLDTLKEREQYYIDTLKPQYNVSKSSKCPMMGRKHNEETLKKFKQRPKFEGEKSHRFGVKWTDEVRAKILKTRIGQKRSDEFKEKQRKNANDKNLARFIKDSCKIKIIDDLGNVYDSLKEAALNNGVSTQTVCDILKGRHNKTRKGRSFKYYENA